MQRAPFLCLIAILTVSCGGSQPASEPSESLTSQQQSAEQSAGTPTLPAANATTGSLTLSGAPRKNKHLQLEVEEAGFDPVAPVAPYGLRYFTVGLRGIALMRAVDVEIPIKPFVFAQNENGCITHPEAAAPWLTQPFGEVAYFTADKATRGQLAFPVPADTKQVRVLIAPAGATLVVAAGEEFKPSWPTPVHTIEDGSTLRVLVLPSTTSQSFRSPPAVGLERVVLDILIENLNDDQGIEFTTSQQLRLVDSAGKFIQPAAATMELGCRLDDLDVVPPGHVRRLLVAYDIPVGTPKRLQYRGFEVEEATVDLP